MTRSALLARARSAAQREMVDGCVIVDPSQATFATDPDTGVVTSTPATVYTGRCKVATFEAHEATPGEAGVRQVVVQRYAVHIPVGSEPVDVGHIVTVTTALFDPLLVGRSYRVEALLHKSMATARRLGVVEVVT